jgi:cyclophilin family peptidyl-prolyl cis-trans isomerase
MSVYVETSAGDIVVDLYTDECPLASKNFLKLCKCAPGSLLIQRHTEHTRQSCRLLIVSAIQMLRPGLEPCASTHAAK